MRCGWRYRQNVYVGRTRALPKEPLEEVFLRTNYVSLDRERKPWLAEIQNLHGSLGIAGSDSQGEVLNFRIHSEVVGCRTLLLWVCSKEPSLGGHGFCRPVQMFLCGFDLGKIGGNPPSAISLTTEKIRIHLVCSGLGTSLFGGTKRFHCVRCVFWGGEMKNSIPILGVGLLGCTTSKDIDTQENNSDTAEPEQEMVGLWIAEEFMGQSMPYTYTSDSNNFSIVVDLLTFDFSPAYDGSFYMRRVVYTDDGSEEGYSAGTVSLVRDSDREYSIDVDMAENEEWLEDFSLDCQMQEEKLYCADPVEGVDMLLIQDPSSP